jgi:hypothetical protein
MINSDDEALNICPKCNLYPVGRFNGEGYNKSLPPLRDICIRCSYKEQNESRRIKANQKREQKRREKGVIALSKRPCEICNTIYMPLVFNQKYCSSNCLEKSKGLKLNSKWKEKEYKDAPKISQEAREKLKSSHLYYSNPEWTKKFKTVRG